MKIGSIIRILFGILLIWYTGNEFAKLALPQVYVPLEPMPQGTAAYEFVVEAIHTGYLYWLVKGLTVAVGIMLLFNLFTPLALLIYTPLAINHLLFSVFVNPSGLWIALVMGLFLIYLLIQNRAYYRPIFQIR